MFGVERFSFLPDLQRDGGDLARQRQPGHFRSYALGQQSGVKLTEYSLAKGSHRGGTLEQAFQFVVMVPVQTADLRWPGLALHLSVDHAVLGAVVCFQRQPAISPELALAAEAKRSLHASDQQGSANWSQKGNTGQYRRGGMFAALYKQIAPGLAAESLASGYARASEMAIRPG